MSGDLRGPFQLIFAALGFGKFAYNEFKEGAAVANKPHSRRSLLRNTQIGTLKKATSMLWKTRTTSMYCGNK